MPLRITVGQRPAAALGRSADTPPFWGGSRIYPLIGGSFAACSNGFAISFPGQPNTYMISAAHCGQENGSIYISGQSYPTTGVMGFRPVCRDTGLIRYPGGVAGSIYIGAWNSSASALVGGAAQDLVGNFVNTGGASSGEHARLRVSNVDQFSPIGGIPCATVGPLNIASTTDGSCAVFGGDSGGPVYYSRSPAGAK